MRAAEIKDALADHVSAKQAAKMLGRTARLVGYLAAKGALRGAVRVGRDWWIPRAAVLARKKLKRSELPKGGRGKKAYV